MKKILIALGCCVASHAWAASYVIKALPYRDILNYSSCVAGQCAVYGSAMLIEGRINTSRRFDPNLISANLKEYLTDFTVSDGLTTYSSNDPALRLSFFAYVSTDSQGRVIGFFMGLQRTQRGTWSPGADNRIDLLNLQGGATLSTYPRHNVQCTFDPSVDECRFIANDAASSQAGVSGIQLVEDLSAKVPVFRFYNATTRSHFFTASYAERDQVKATLPQFAYEGAVFFARDRQLDGASPVFRFYNTASGSHFYTISAAERDSVIANLPTYRYEGAAWYGFAQAVTGTTPVHRFYRPATNTHFYTASQQEMEHVRANDPSFKYEGVAYHAWDASY